LQEFRVLIRKNASGGNSTTWSLALWENGSQVSVLATGTTTSTSGEVVAGTWNASSLGTADGSLVECRLQQTGGGSSGSGANRRRIEIGAVEWNVVYTGAAAALEGSAAAESSATGALTTEIRLAGEAAAESSATGELTTGIPLAGEAAAQAAAAGTLTDAPAELESSAAAESSATGALTTEIRLAGEAAAESSATGELTTGIPLAGEAAAQAAATGNLTDAPVAFEGGAAASAAAIGTLSRGLAWPVYARLAWPAYTVRRAPGVIRTQLDSGPPRQHRVRHRTMVEREVTVLLASQTDYAAFLAWFDGELARGVKWFDWPDPADGEVKLARIKDGLLARETPARKQMDHWRVALTIETWEGA
jgi:hypothetical protein